MKGAKEKLKTSWEATAESGSNHPKHRPTSCSEGRMEEWVVRGKKGSKESRMTAAFLASATGCRIVPLTEKQQKRKRSWLGGQTGNQTFGTFFY